MTPTDISTLRARYQRTGTDKPLWQEVCADVAALVAEVERLMPKKSAEWDVRFLYGDRGWDAALNGNGTITLGHYRCRWGVWQFMAGNTPLVDAPDEATCRTKIEEYACAKGYEVRT